jgi:hypothetical protein
LSSLAIGVAPVAFGFASGLILDHTRNARFVSRPARVHLGTRCRSDGGFPLRSFCLNALCFFGFHPLTGSAPLFAGCGNRLAFGFSGEPRRFCRFLRGTIGIEKGSFGVGGSRPALGKVIASVVFQISFPVRIGAKPNGNNYLTRFEADAAASATSRANRASRSRRVFSAWAWTSELGPSADRSRARNWD